MTGLGGITGILTTGLSMMGAAEERKRQAEAQAKADIFQSYNEQILAQEGYVKGFQTNTAMTQHLMNVVNNIKAVQGSSGTEPGSPTEQSIVNRTEGLGWQDTARTVENINLEAKQHEAAAAFYKQSAQDILSQGGGIF